MMRGFVLLAGAALVTAAAPALAGEQGELSCLQNGYTVAQISEIDGLLGKVSMLGSGEDPAMDALGLVVMTGALACAEKLGWSEAEVEPALFYEFGRLLEVGFLRHGNLSEGEIAKVDTALAKGDRTALWAALEEQLAIGMDGQHDSVSDENATLFGLFMLETGLGLDEAKAEQVGVYLAAKAMQRASARQFVAQ